MGQESTGTATARALAAPFESAARHKPLARAWYQSAPVWLVVGAFVMRIGFMLAVGTYRFEGRDDQSDVNEDTYVARSLTEGHGFSSPFSTTYTGPTAWVTPVYPYFVSAVFKYFGVMSHKSYF